MELSVFDLTASSNARPSDTAVDATRVDDDGSRFNAFIRAATNAAEHNERDDHPQPDQSRPNHAESVEEPPKAPDAGVEAVTSEPQPPHAPLDTVVTEDPLADTSQIDGADSAGASNTTTTEVPGESGTIFPTVMAAVTPDMGATVVPSISVALPDAAATHGHAPAILPATNGDHPVAPASPDVAEQALKALAAANPPGTPAAASSVPAPDSAPVNGRGSTPAVAPVVTPVLAPVVTPVGAPASVTATPGAENTTPQVIAPDAAAQQPAASDAPRSLPTTKPDVGPTDQPLHRSADQPADKPIVAELPARAAPQATTATVPQTSAPLPTVTNTAITVTPDPEIGRLPAMAAAVAQANHQGTSLRGDAADTLPEDPRPDLPQSAAAAAMTARAKTSPSIRPAWARTGANPTVASQAPGQFNIAQSGTPPGEQPNTNINASSVSDFAVTIGREQLAPGQTVRHDGGTPDLAAFRESLSTVLPDAATGASLEGIRSTGRPLGVELAARAQHHMPNVPEQISIRIRQAVTTGENEIRLQLQPKELGRIDIKIDVSDSGKVSAVMVAERADTLDLLLRDQRNLERALQQAGLDTDPDSLEFDLQDADDEGLETADDNADGQEPEPEQFIETALNFPTTGITGDPTLDGVDIRI